VDSMIDDGEGTVWMNTVCGIVRVARDDLERWMSGAKRTRPAELLVLADSDGVQSRGLNGSYSPHIAKSADGRPWVVTPGGINLLNPRHLPRNTLPPPVHIEQIVANHVAQPVTSDSATLALPPLIRDLQIDYTALSLVAPENVRFRYRLEG